jgi:hypothetical protein
LEKKSDDPNDFKVLTPGHFLIGRPLNSRPQNDLCDTLDNLLNRWQLVQKSFQHFWKRWSMEYLNLLQQRSKQYKDGIIRVVSVKTPNGTFKKPVNKICPIPVEA